MCRLFGFRSVLKSQVHQSLLGADNALAAQSAFHPDGWGVAYYVADSPHLLKSTSQALDDAIFTRLSGIVSANTVLAHIRKATQGNLSPLNSHPFQHGRWVFAHNGDIPNFSKVSAALREQVSPIFRRYILGDTDSEVIFFLLLTELSRRAEIHRPGVPLDVLVDCVRNTVALVREISDDADNKALLTFILSNGESMLAHEGGKDLLVSTHKKSCSETASCSFFAPECLAPTRNGYVSHFLASSEPLQGENVWRKLCEGDIVAVDCHMRYHEFLTKKSTAALRVA